MIIDCDSGYFLIFNSRLALWSEQLERDRTPSRVNNNRTVTKRMLVLFSFIASTEKNTTRMNWMLLWVCDSGDEFTMRCGRTTCFHIIHGNPLVTLKPSFYLFYHENKMIFTYIPSLESFTPSKLFRLFSPFSKAIATRVMELKRINRNLSFFGSFSTSLSNL